MTAIQFFRANIVALVSDSGRSAASLIRKRAVKAKTLWLFAIGLDSNAKEEPGTSHNHRTIPLLNQNVPRYIWCLRSIDNPLKMLVFFATIIQLGDENYVFHLKVTVECATREEWRKLLFRHP